MKRAKGSDNEDGDTEWNRIERPKVVDVFMHVYNDFASYEADRAVQ